MRDDAAWAQRSQRPEVAVPRFQYPETPDRSRVSPRQVQQVASGGYSGPFSVISRPKAGVTGKWQLAVNFGVLNITGTPTNQASIAGVPDSPGMPSLLTWFDWSGDADCVYLDVTGIDFTVPATPPLNGAGYAINSQSQSGSFDPGADAWASNAYVNGNMDPDFSGEYDQTEACYPLAFITVGTGGAPVIQQQCLANLIMANMVIDGSPAVYPMPN